MQEITAPLATLPDDAVPAVAEVDFPLVLRGYDRIAVDAYVRKTSQLVAELQAMRSPEAAVRRALERVGEEVSGILQRAHETAEKITATSRREAEDRLENARQEAARIVSDAETRVKDLDAETDRIWAERHRIVEDTRELARQLVGLAESASERFPAEEVASDAPALGDDTEATAALPTRDAAEDETVVAAPSAEDDQLDWGAAEQWRAEPEEIAEPPECAEPGDVTVTHDVPDAHEAPESDSRETPDPDPHREAPGETR